MTPAHSQTIVAGGGTGGRLRLAFGVAAILALVAWSALDGRPAADRPVLQAKEQITAPEAQPLFDGRGKWGGY